jgi:hypothetical protein
MSTILSTAAIIWLRALAVNALLLGLVAIKEAGIYFFAVIVGVLLGSLIVTAPLLIIVYGWLRCFCALPYDTRDKLPWLAFVLMATAAAFYMVVALFMRVPKWEEEPLFGWIIGIGLLAVLIAVYWSRKTIIILANNK